MSHVIITMLVAYTWNVILFKDLYVSIGANTRDEPIIMLGLIAMLIQGVVLAYVYPFFYRPGPHPVVQGIKFNALMGVLNFGSMGFGITAKYDIDPIVPFLMFTFMFQAFQFVFAGAALGFIYGRIEHRQ